MPALGQLLGDAERYAPSDLAGRKVDGHELAPRRFLAWPRRPPATLLIARRVGRSVVRPEARKRPTDCTRAPVRHALDTRAFAGPRRRRVAGVWLEPADTALAARVDEHE